MITPESRGTLKAHCLCKAHIFTTEVSEEKLPLTAHACHCNSCRQCIGALYTMIVLWPESPANVDLSELKKYEFSDRRAIFFCDTCSTPLFFSNAVDKHVELGVFTGALQNDPGNLIKLVDHIYVSDTHDGGATMWLRKPNADGSEAKRFKEDRDSEEYPFGSPEPTAFTGYEKRVEDTVSIQCKCKGVDLLLHRGDYSNTKKEDLPWFIDPTTHKPVGGCCACDSCRLSSGTDAFVWTFSELANISFPGDIKAEGKPFPRNSMELKALIDTNDARIKTLKYYASSPDVQRYFCSNCSACVFYAIDDRPGMVDVAVGVLHASDGARAEGFISWAFGQVGGADDTKGGWRSGLTKCIERESEEWRIERGYPKNWRRVAREEGTLKY